MTKDELERLRALEDERVNLVKTLRELEATLSQRRLYEGGRMLGPVEYNKRRDTATRRKVEVLNRLTDVNAETKALRRKRNEAQVAAMGIDVADPLTLIAHAYNLLHRLACDGVDLDAHEQTVLDGLRAYLANHRGGA